MSDHARETDRIRFCGECLGPLLFVSSGMVLHHAPHHVGWKTWAKGSQDSKEAQSGSCCPPASTACPALPCLSKTWTSCRATATGLVAGATISARSFFQKKDVNYQDPPGANGKVCSPLGHRSPFGFKLKAYLITFS